MTAPIPASIADACAAHDRHRLDVLDALLDEAAPSAVRELLGAALDLCASLRADRDALAAKLDAAPKVCAIHSYEHGPGPCMTCGAWPPGTRELIAACRTRIAGLESAADERSRTGQMPESERAEWISAAVAVADALGGSLGPVAGASGTIDPREWVHFAAGLADRAKKLAARVAKLEWERSRVADASAESFHHGAWLRLMTAIDPNATITDDALRSLAERTTAQVTADREVARLAARVAELEARPVLTHEILSAAIKNARKVPPCIARQAADEYMPHLGPVTLPAQDRAEELCRAYHERAADMDGHMVGRWQYHGPESQAICTEAMRHALTSLGAPPTSPPVARQVFAGVSEDELIRLFYVVGTDGIDHGEQCPPIDSSDRNGIRAVLARLEVSLVAPVDPEAVAIHVINDMATRRSDQASWTGCTIGYQSAVTAAMRATLIARGIPVTTEVGK